MVTFLGVLLDVAVITILLSLAAGFLVGLVETLLVGLAVASADTAISFCCFLDIIVNAVAVALFFGLVGVLAQPAW